MEHALAARAGSAPLGGALDQLAAAADSLAHSDEDRRAPRAMSEDSRPTPYDRPYQRGKERRLTRRRTPKDALEILEATFAEHPYITRLSREERDSLAERTGMDDKRLCDWWRNKRSRDTKNNGGRDMSPYQQHPYMQAHSYPPAMMYGPPNGARYYPGPPGYPAHPYSGYPYPPPPPHMYAPRQMMPPPGPYPGEYPGGRPAHDVTPSTTGYPSSTSSPSQTVPVTALGDRVPVTAVPIATTQLEPSPATHFATSSLNIGTWSWSASSEAPVITFDPAKDMIHYTHSDKGWLERVEIPMAAVDRLAFSGPSASRDGALLVFELRAPPSCVAALAKAQWAGPTLAWRPCADFTDGQSLLSNRHEIIVPEAQRMAQVLLGLSATRPSLRSALTFPTVSSPPLPASHASRASDSGTSPSSFGPATPSMEPPRSSGVTPRTPTTAQLASALSTASVVVVSTSNGCGTAPMTTTSEPPSSPMPIIPAH